MNCSLNDLRLSAAATVLVSAMVSTALVTPREAHADCQADPPILSRPVAPHKVTVPPGSPQLSTPPGPMVTVPEGEPLPPPPHPKPSPIPDPVIQLHEDPPPQGREAGPRR